MTPDFILMWLAQWFEAHTGVAADTIRAQPERSYFEAGWIDSFHFMNLLGDIESHFAIQFANHEFQDRRFATLVGLTDIIISKGPASA